MNMCQNMDAEISRIIGQIWKALYTTKKDVGQEPTRQFLK